MPLYEYKSESDGEVLTLLRPMRDADAPVDDPLGQGRQFVRMHSTFATAGGAAAGSSAGGASMGGPSGAGGCCPCGKASHHCGRAN
ncbi:MAG: zinc ribbon domain-containing protein [Phycisphaerae bacterium]|nr:zinc ribbon domain-containing protein [Phycisphaerae bacterium]